MTRKQNIIWLSTSSTLTTVCSSQLSYFLVHNQMHCFSGNHDNRDDTKAKFGDVDADEYDDYCDGCVVVDSDVFDDDDLYLHY